MSVRLLAFLLAIVPSANAQNIVWHSPANTGLGSCTSATSRMDDLYFWTPTDGVAVKSGFIAKTRDGGDNWDKKLQPSQSPYFRSVEVLDGAAIMVSGALNGRVFRSTDTGETWTEISTAIADTGQGARNICGLAHEGNTFYGVGWYASTRARLFTSTDAGITWQTTYLDTTVATSLVDIIAVGNGILFAAGGRRFSANRESSVVIRSGDGGATWTKVFEDTVLGGRIWKLQAVTPTTLYGSIEPMYNADTVAIIRSKNGGLSWSVVGVGSLPSSQYGTQGVGFLNEARGWVGGYYTGMFETVDSGASWHYIFQGQDMNRYFRVNAGLMYASGRCPVKLYDSAAAASVPAHPSAIGRSHRLSSPVPNPVSGLVTFKFYLSETTNCMLDVVDTRGRRIFPVYVGRLRAGDHSFTWDCSDLTPGAYAVRLETDEGPLGQNFAVIR